MSTAQLMRTLSHATGRLYAPFGLYTLPYEKKHQTLHYMAVRLLALCELHGEGIQFEQLPFNTVHLQHIIVKVRQNRQTQLGELHDAMQSAKEWVIDFIRDGWEFHTKRT